MWSTSDEYKTPMVLFLSVQKFTLTHYGRRIEFVCVARTNQFLIFRGSPENKVQRNRAVCAEINIVTPS